MIDRIVIQIADIERDYIESKLNLKKNETRGDDKVEQLVGSIDNIKVQYYPLSGILRLDGSLHKYACGNNYSLFTEKNSIAAIKKLAVVVGVDIDRFFITKIEFGINIPMSKPPMRYIDSILSYNSNLFLPMPPLKSTVYGKHCKLCDYTIKFYDKTYDTWEKDRVRLSENILRYEILMRKSYATDNGFTNINAKGLLGVGLYYRKLRQILRTKLDILDFRDDTLNYTGIKSSDVKKYLFVTSNNFDVYLEYLKVHGEENDRTNAMTARRRIKKKMRPYITNDLIEELKEKFKETLLLIADRKKHD